MPMMFIEPDARVVPYATWKAEAATNAAQLAQIAQLTADLNACLNP